MNHIARFFLGSALAFFLISLTTACTTDAKRSLGIVPTAYGKVNEIAVVTDKRIWDGPVGDTIRYYYSAAYPILPQPEPIYDLRFFSVEDLNKEPLRKQLKHYLIVGNLNEADSPVSQLIRSDIGEEKAQQAKTDKKLRSLVGRDKWAKDQVLIYQYAHSDDDLIESIKNNFAAAAKRLDKDNMARIEATAFFGNEVNRKLMEEVKTKMDAEMRVPEKYFQAVSDGEVIWMRMETDAISSNLILKRVPYTDKKQLSKEGIKAIRDSIGRKYITTSEANTYMRINDTDLPMYVSAKTLNNNYVLEARGIWEIVNDYMGGAFVSYLIYNPDKKDLLFVDAFLHAPGKDKRNYMQQLEYIISGVKY
ncbi:MAG: DUF4837 family protein [Saprospiraceae bacterium]|nr:DUF4837 family protein [Saprospiraceae bacterium]